MAPLEHQGCALFYEVSGAGPPVVLIQDVGIHGGGWRPPTCRNTWSFIFIS